MKINVTFKNPDALDYAIEDFKESHPDVADKESAIRKLARKYFEYGEYVTIQVDLDKGTATVLPVR